MQALILAAGRGSRLGDQAGGVPKCLLEVDRRPLIEHQIEALASCGIGPVGVVIGYGGDEVRETLGIKAECVRNPRWSVTNSLYSFWLARDWVKEDVLILNCDVLFTPEIVERLLDVKGDALAFDSGSGERREEMSVRVSDGCLTDMSKTLPADQVSGENVGMIKLTLETAREVFAIAGELVEQGREREWLGSAIREVASRKPIRAVDIAGLPWAEIDFPSDLERARKVTWPAIASRQRRARGPRRLLRLAAIAAAGLALVVATAAALRAPRETVWETIAITGPKAVTITNGVQHRQWMLVGEGDSVGFHAEGPTVVRLYARPVFDDDGAGSARLVLRLGMDDANPTIHTIEGIPSRTWKLDDRRVGKQERIEWRVPAGSHHVTVTLVASEASACLVRFAELSPDI